MTFCVHPKLSCPLPPWGVQWKCLVTWSFLCLFEAESIHSPGFLGTHSVNQGSLNQNSLPPSASDAGISLWPSSLAWNQILYWLVYQGFSESSSGPLNFCFLRIPQHRDKHSPLWLARPAPVWDVYFTPLHPCTAVSIETVVSVDADGGKGLPRTKQENPTAWWPAARGLTRKATLISHCS